MNKQVRFACSMFVMFTFYVGMHLDVNAGSCDNKTLRKLQEISLDNLRVKNNPFPIESKHTAYYKGKKLKIFDLVVPGEHGKVELRYWVQSESSYLVEYREFWYAPIVDPKAEIKIIQELGGLLFICEKKLLAIEELNDLKIPKYLSGELSFINRVFSNKKKKGTDLFFKAD